MKKKFLLLILSIISFSAISFTSCGDDGYMDRGGAAGNPPPPAYSINYDNTRQADSIKINADLPNN